MAGAELISVFACDLVEAQRQFLIRLDRLGNQRGDLFLVSRRQQIGSLFTIRKPEELWGGSGSVAPYQGRWGSS
jgi:hypothetical protein